MAWKIYTMADAYSDRPPVRYTVDGFFELPSVNIVFGAPSSLKSMLMLDMCMCVAKGHPWLTNLDGIVEKPTTQTNVLWVDFDNGKRMTFDRVRAVGKHYAVAVDDPAFTFVTCPPDGLNMGNVNSVLNLQQAIESTKSQLLVVDNLGLVSGGVDENSNAMVPIMGAFRALAEKKRLAVVIIHHERKGSGSHVGRIGETLRGHSSIEGSLDRSFAIVRENRSDTITVIPAKERGASIQQFSARFRNLNQRHELIEAWFEGVDSDNPDRKAEKAILAFLKQGDKNQRDLVEQVKLAASLGKNKAHEAIQKLVEAKQIIERKGPKNASLYSLPQSEQLILAPNKDIVRYSEEIFPSNGYVQ